MNALKSKNTTQLSEAVALRAEYEAATDAKKNMFKSLKLESLPPEEVDELARMFDGMKVMNMNVPKSEARRGIIVGKQEDTKYITRTIQMRREKDGWKVIDFSGERHENRGIRQPSTKKKSN